MASEKKKKGKRLNVDAGKDLKKDYSIINDSLKEQQNQDVIPQAVGSDTPPSNASFPKSVALEVDSKQSDLDDTDPSHIRNIDSPSSTQTKHEGYTTNDRTTSDNVPEELIGAQNVAIQNEKELSSIASTITLNEMVDADSLQITFLVKYSTTYGQNLFITANHSLFGNNEVSKAYPMQYFNHEYWIAEVAIPKSHNNNITYNYCVVNQDGTYIIEWGDDKTFNAAQLNVNDALFVDTWNDAALYENVFYTEPFSKVLLEGQATGFSGKQSANSTHIFKVKAPFVSKDQAVIISGNNDSLGKWNLNDPIFLNKNSAESWWTIELDLSTATYPIEYKYAIYDTVQNSVVKVESGSNRILQNIVAAKQKTIVSDGFGYFPNDSFKGAGVAIPVFSLRSKKGLGIGEFNDLKLLVDWAKHLGLKLIQILPINDTTATFTKADSYPYAAISAFALHPIYLNLETIAGEAHKNLVDELQEVKQRLNSEDAVNYEEVVSEKWSFLKAIFPLQKQAVFASEQFKSFFTTNAHWLVPYAAFSFFRDKNNTADFSRWSENGVYIEQDIQNLAGDFTKAPDDIAIHFYIQFHLHTQLQSATAYAHKNGIILKGDIPIGIFRNSADAWQQPELYNMDMQAGAPPDDFAVKGQNWGFPTYNWQAMAQDGFSWWKRRFEQMRYYFDAFRIDHILGFFRIWSIPMHAVEGILGHFVPAVPIHISEFHQRGIYVDIHRLTEPFIVDSILWDVFGNEMQPVKKQFLQDIGYGQFALLPQFDTQKKVDEHFSRLEQSGFNKKLKQGLFDLISNVIFFKVDHSDGQEFHFRISIDHTSSFQYLDGDAKHKIWDLYIDYFYKRQDDFWRQEAMKKLPELKRSTNMLICGEDLGMVPATVPGVMKDLAILSLEIQRMPKDPKREFFHPKDAPYLSVVTPSTHDMSTIRGWWEEDREKTQRFYNNELGKDGGAPTYCEPWINKLVIIQHLYSPAMWSIFQLQDLMGSDKSLRRSSPHEERINVPADPKHYWRYRMHKSLEDLMTEHEFNFELKGHIIESGR